MEKTELKQSAAKVEVEHQQKMKEMQDELNNTKLTSDRLKNRLDFAEEKHSILNATSEGFKKEAKALEAKCKSITEALTKSQVEAEKYRTEYSDMREKLLAAEVKVKSSETEKHLIKEGEKRLLQENQSLLDQQRSQNVLLTNLQSVQNNLERIPNGNQT